MLRRRQNDKNVLNNKNKKERTNDDDSDCDSYMKDAEFIAYDQDVDGALFTSSSSDDNQHLQSGLRLKLSIPLDETQPAYSILGNNNRYVLFSMFFPEKEAIPGWLGGRMKASALSSSRSGEESNCITLPLPGAAPLCAVVATRDVAKGEEIIQTSQSLKSDAVDELKAIIAKEYRRELSTLQMYIEAACETALASFPPGEMKQQQQQLQQQHQLGPFHELNQLYPGLKQIHQDPDIYSIDAFLTDEECDRLITKSQPHLVPCLVKNDENGKVEQDSVRTSTNANVPQCEVPSIVEKITNLARCTADQLEILQVLNYKKGQEFIPHTDGFVGKFDACGFEQASRQVTIFCYLNDVNEGGSTNFPEIRLAIQPKKGTAVIHFPADVQMREDTRTLHQGSPAIDEKWLLTTWVWNRPRSDEMYDESKLPSLSSDII
jgi:prolyl 4-hydroxylase